MRGSPRGFGRLGDCCETVAGRVRGLPVKDTWTVRRVASWMSSDFEARGIESARLDADLLLAHALGCDRVQLYLDLDRPLTDAERGRVRELVGRRRDREPVAYILGRREFFGRRFAVTSDVLIPRPDTETLVEAALARLSEDAEGLVVDLCTGSGIVGITLALERPGIRVALCDVSASALAIAKLNAEAHGIGARVDIFVGDLFEALPTDAPLASLVTVNPPYVAETERDTLAPEIRQHEPPIALFAGSDGLDVLRKLAEAVPERLSPGGRFMTEVGMGQAPSVTASLTARGLIDVAVHRDLAGIERVVEGTRPPDGT